MTTIFILLICIVVLWYYFSRLREDLTSKARMICQRLDVQLLDQSVSLKRFYINKDDDNNPALFFEYQFEISQNGIDRFKSSAFLKNQKIDHFIIYHPDGNIINCGNNLSDILNSNISGKENTKGI